MTQDSLQKNSDKEPRKLFGTDGIRGCANVYPMDPNTVLKIGKAVGLFFKKKHKKNLRYSLVKTQDVVVIFWNKLFLLGFVVLGQIHFFLVHYLLLE